MALDFKIFSAHPARLICAEKEIRRRVLSWQLPTAWVDLVVAALHASTARDLDGLEVFAGAKHLETLEWQKIAIPGCFHADGVPY